MTQAPNAAAVTKAFSDIPALLEAAPTLQTRGRFLDCDCRLGPMEPAFHGLLALTKRGEAVLEGDLHSFMTHLQYFKDLLALRRLRQAKAAA